jgi:hypothetical protein
MDYIQADNRPVDSIDKEINYMTSMLPNNEFRLFKKYELEIIFFFHQAPRASKSVAVASHVQT